MTGPRHSPPGTLEYDPDADRLRCVICRQWYRNLAQHARLTHGLSAADYRELAGLNRTTPLIAPGLRERHRQRQGPRLRRLHAEGRIVTWADDPDWFAEVKRRSVEALREGLRPEARQSRRARWDTERRREAAERRRARNLAGERATPEQIAAGIRRGTITCERCGAVVPRTGTRQRLCPDCRREHERAYQREWKRAKEYTPAHARRTDDGWEVTCRRCGATFRPPSLRYQYCVTCRPIVRREWVRESKRRARQRRQHAEQP